MRVFAGLPLPKGASRSIAEWLAPSKSRGGHGKWVDPRLYHLTLHFFGEVATDQVDVLAADLLRISARPITVGFGPAGTFGRPPRVLYLGMKQGTEKIEALQQEYVERISALGYKQETRSYVPHLTLARSRDGRGVRPVPNKAIDCSCTLDRVVLYQSRSGPSGPQYIPIETVMLGEADQ